MLERNVHHIPVLSAAGQVLGVIDDGDLVAAEGRKPLLLRRAIALADSPAELAAAAAGLNPVIIALHDAPVTAEHLTAVCSVVFGRADPAAGSSWPSGTPGRRPCRLPGSRWAWGG